VRVVFLGDIMTHAQQLKYAKTPDGYDFAKQFARVKPYLRRAMVVGNLETTFAGEGRKYSGYPAFNTPDELGQAIASLGVHVVTLANNHILDQGLPGVARTIDTLNGLGILWTGVSERDVVAPGQPLLVEYGGLRWAMVNFTYGTNLPPSGEDGRGIAVNVIDEEAVAESLRVAAELRPDVTVALFHWGNEYQYSPAAAQTRIAEVAAAAGADLVIGTHPHVLQPVTVIPGSGGPTLVAYSLGNFISNQRQAPRERAAVLAAEFEKLPGGGARLRRASVAPVYVSSTCRKAGDCTIQTLYAAATPPPPEPAAIPVSPPGPQLDEEGVPVHSLLLYDSPGSAGTSAPAAGSAGAVMAASGSGPGSGADAAGVGAGGGPASGNGVEASSGEDDPDLPAKETSRALAAGERILEFLGVRGEPDEYGYYTLWDASEPYILPKGTRKSPN
jgi:poly-gamma-glutamate synthesis protein (capsule biosynthesis protein)